jgi:cell division protein FtsQ
MAKSAATTERKAKAVAQRREQQRLALLLWLKVMLLVAVVGGGLYWGVTVVTDPTLLPLKVVRTDGKFRYMQRQDLEQAVAGLTRDGFLMVDVAAIRDRARTLPWVDRVSVRRVWPDSLQLWVEEHVPLSRWQEKAMLNVRGEVFRPKYGTIPAGLPLLSGPDGSEQELARHYMEVKVRLGSMGLEIEEMKMDERRAWSMRLDSGAVIRLGSKDLKHRLARFYSIYPLLQADKRQLQEVDLRYTNGFAVTWKKLTPTAGVGRKTETLRGLV